MIEVPLRAFLMLRTNDGTWNVTVCRDLGAILRAWKSRKDPEKDVAILHTGFERPPSYTFEEIAVAYPGCMLLTAAAKYTLPNSFTASSAPVGFVNNFAIFIGLQGWGYLLKDPTVRANRNDAIEVTTTNGEPLDWIASYITENPSAAETLFTYGINDDKSYLNREFGLDLSMRHLLGVFRVHHLMGTNNEDPCELARAAPPWLSECKLDSLGITVRASNVFWQNDIKTVSDLASWSSDKLLRCRNFGRKSLRDTLDTLNMALKKGPVQSVNRNVNLDETADSDRLLIDLHQSLLSFPVRERNILIRRLGFEKSPETLQEIGDYYGITRERIRQIETQTTEKWMREFNWGHILVKKITQLLIGRNFPLLVAGVEAIDSWFEGVSSHLEFFKNLVQMVCIDRLHILEIDGIMYFSLIDQTLWESTVSEAKALLSYGAGQGWSETYAQSFVQGLLPDTAREFGALLWEKTSHLCHFSTNPDGVRIFTSYGSGAEQLIEAILAESESPLHYKEIAERANLRQGEILESSRIHNAVTNVGLLFARGTYGLARHIPLSDEQMSRVLIEAEDIVCSDASGKQWHTSEILLELLERLDASFEGLDKYVLDIALSRSKILRPLKQMTWTVAGQYFDDETRIGIHQAVISLVKAAGHPLSTSEIKERLTTVRGVNELFQISPIDPLIRIQPGVWGLNDRDVPLTREQQRKLIEDLVRELSIRQSGIHASEISRILYLGNCTVETLLSIAIQDSRLKIAPGRYVYLSLWGNPRRESIPLAVATVIEAASAPLTIEQIITLVESRVTRKCEHSVVLAALQTLEAEFDSTTGTWIFRKSSTGNDEDENNGADVDAKDIK